jgi:GNAT superfamily N-acetyltransferase
MKLELLNSGVGARGAADNKVIFGDHIRTVEPPDFRAVANLSNICFGDDNALTGVDPETPHTIANEVASGRTIFAMFETLEIVGIVLLDPSRGCISKLAVLHSKRKLGYGRRLVEAAENKAKTLNWPKVLVGVLENRPSLLQYYGKIGYVVTGERKDVAAQQSGSGTKPRLIIMSKPLVNI